MRSIKHIIVILIAFQFTNALAQCPTVGISGTHVSCYGGSNGTVSALVTGGSGSFQYVWNNGGNSPAITGLVADIYYVNVTDLVSGCTVFNLFVVNEPNQLVSSLTQQDIKCFGQPAGSIDLTVGGGTPLYTYAWSNGAVGQDVAALVAGTYSVTITDSKGCKATNSATIIQTASAVNSTITGDHVNCPLGSDGSVNLTPFGGEAPYTFSWNSGTYLSEDINGLAAGTYSVIITDALGCTAINGIVITEPTPIVSTITGTDVNCFGGSNGFVDLNPSGGTLPYNFNWTSTLYTLGNTEDLVNVAADSYSVTITDANGCTAVNNFTINQPTQLASSISGTNVSCNGYTDGTITLVVNGGSAPYGFAWENSAGPIASTTQNLTNLAAETYKVTVTDFKGCIATNSIIISQPLLPLNSSITGTNVKCFGDNSGTADLTIVGGTSPYAINWSNGVFIEDQNNLFAGNYFVTIVDDNGCNAASSIIITQPAAPVAASSIVTNVSCFGFNDGGINYTVTGGTQPYTYSWINSENALSVVSQDITNFPAEIYVVTITDANNCVSVDTSIITEPTLIQSSIVSQNINCYAQATGTINLTLTGGTLPYSINWSNNAVTEDISSLTAGTYTVTITDANGCSHTNGVTLTQPSSGLSSSNFVKNVTCYGGADGYIFYDVQGGTQPYNYNWSSGDSLANIFNLVAGTYIITTADANGCILTNSIVVAQPPQVIITAVTIPVRCFGQNNGTIDITISGGTTPYTYEWMNSNFVLSAITQDLVNYPSEVYNVKVTDSVGCTASMSIPLHEPAPLGASVTANNITCAGGADGNIDINISGGVLPYAYAWSNGAVSEDLLNIPVGTYVVTITDANNCSMIRSYTLLEPPPIEISYQTQEVSCADQHDGVIYAIATGGTGAYTYAWSNGTILNPATDLSGTTYTLTVSDVSGCNRSIEITMPVNPKECIEIPTAFSPNGDGKNDTWQIKNIELYPDCVMKIFNRWGNLLFESTGYKEFWNGRYNGNKLPSETYYFILELGNESTPKTGSITLIY